MNKITDIKIFGIGAAGSNTFLHLLYAYPALNYSVIDFDTIENRNFEAGTQPYSKMDLNRPKTQALQRIATTLKNKKIEAINKKITSSKDITAMVKDPKTTLLIDCFDNADSRNLFTSLKKYNVLHIGFSATLCGEAVWDDTFVPMNSSKADSGIDVCENTISRSFVFSLSALSSMIIINFIENEIKENLYFDKNMIIRKF